jgi:NADP-dependent 3-hydroxy acid dehydrogenase YdfG
VGSFAGRMAVVTGASGGIGGAIAATLAGAGADLVLVGRNLEKLVARAEQLAATRARVDPFAMDLTADGDIERLVDFVATHHGKLDILVHSAGAIAHGKLEDASVDAFDRQYAANLRGPFLLTQRLLPLLRRRCGDIVFVNSSVGLTARPNVGQFAATQHAFKALADALREEVAADGIRVTSIYPGRTATPRIEALHAQEGRPYRPELLLQPEDVASIVVNALALPRTAAVTNVSVRPLQKSY